MKFDFVNYISNFHDHKGKEIIIHHSATPDGKVNDWRAIKLWHTGKTGSADPTKKDFNPYIAKPDLDIGYNFGIEFEGADLNVYQGRSMMINGAHCIGHNDKALGICIVGCFDIIPPSEKHYTVCAELCEELMKHFGIPLNQIFPHRQFANKTCPGKKFDMDILKDFILRRKNPPKTI